VASGDILASKHEVEAPIGDAHHPNIEASRERPCAPAQVLEPGAFVDDALGEHDRPEREEQAQQQHEPSAADTLRQDIGLLWITVIIGHKWAFR
jgi:hypothetical protein